MTNYEMMEIANRRAHELWEECDMEEYNRVRAIAERCETGNPTTEDVEEVTELAEEFAERDAEAQEF